MNYRGIDDIEDELRRTVDSLTAHAPSPDRFVPRKAVGRGRARKALAVLAAAGVTCSAVLVIALRTSGDEGQRVGIRGETGTPTAPSGSAPAEPSTLPGETPVHTCDRRLLGEGGAIGDGEPTPPSDWRSRSVMVGPVGFFNLGFFSEIPPELFDPNLPTSHATNGIIFTVILEADRSATVAVPDGARDSVLLLDTTRTTPFPGPNPSLADGVDAIRLEACPTVDTAFNLALIPTGPQCVPLDVALPDGTPTGRVVVPLGEKDCS